MQHGSLDNFLEKHQTIDKRSLLWMCVQIAQGMEYIGTKGIIHGDLAARNVLLKSDQSTECGYLLKISGI